MVRCQWLPFFALHIVLAGLTLGQELQLPLNSLQLPPGFQIALYSKTAVNGARSLVRSLGDNDGATIVYVSTRNPAKEVYALVDFESDGTADSVVTVIDSYTDPLGLVWSDGSLYVATTDNILRFDEVDEQVLAGKAFGSPAAISSALPQGQTWHESRYMKMGPDGLLYVGVGAPCNVCPCAAVKNTSYCSINTLDPANLATAPLVRYAKGVRNTVGFDFHPDTGELYFTDNGRDEMGDDRPDDTLEYAPVRGLDFGFPYCHVQGDGDPKNRSRGAGQVVADPDVFPPELVASRDTSLAARTRYCYGVEQPVQALGPHVAGLGMTFYSGDQFPAAYNRSIFIAEHGSWNRDAKIGYRIANVQLDEEGYAVSHTVFISGWLDDATQDQWGRPVDVMELPDGSLLISDDYGDAVYRVTYEPAAAGDVTQQSVSS